MNEPEDTCDERFPAREEWPNDVRRADRDGESDQDLDGRAVFCTVLLGRDGDRSER